MYRRAALACLLGALLLWAAAARPAGANPPRCKCQEGVPQEVSLLAGTDHVSKPWTTGSHASQGCIRTHNRDVE